MMIPNRAAIAGVVDHTFLKTEREGVTSSAQEKAVQELLTEAATAGAFGVCIRPRWVKLARAWIDDRASSLRVVTVAGFPIGDEWTTEDVIADIATARADGADEFDIVAKIGLLKKGKLEAFQRDLAAISTATGSDMLKIIFENAYLTDDEKALAYELAREALESVHDGAAWPQRMFKTSTGFAQPPSGVAVGATLEDVALMARHAGGRIGVKAAGGVTNYEDAVAFWKAAGAPFEAKGARIPPDRFRIGSSSLLKAL